MNTGDTLAFAIQNILEGINAFSPTMQASATGTTITITYLGTGLPTNSTTGANGNIIGAYTYVSGS
jgi:zinc transporter ZupT